MGSNRNAPCPCGSGRKYKKCCLIRQQDVEGRQLRAQRELARLKAEVGGADDALARWIEHETGQHPIHGALDYEADEPGAPLYDVCALFHSGDGVRSWLEAFLDTDPRLDPAERRWLEAQRASWVGLWEVLDVRPGKGLRLRCRLTDEVRDATAYAIGPDMLPHTHIVGRVVDYNGRSLMCGVHRTMMPPSLADSLWGALRARFHDVAGLPLDRPLRPDELRDPRAQEVMRVLVDATLDEGLGGFDELLDEDGPSFQVVEERFEFDGEREAIAARIRQLDGIEHVVTRDGKEAFHWPQHHEDGDAWDMGSSNLELGDDGLVALTVSASLADQVRARLEGIGLRAVGRVAQALDDVIDDALTELDPSDFEL